MAPIEGEIRIGSEIQPIRVVERYQPVEWQVGTKRIVVTVRGDGSGQVQIKDESLRLNGRPIQVGAGVVSPGEDLTVESPGFNLALKYTER